MQRNNSFHSLLDTWCLHRQWRAFYKLHRKNNWSIIVFLSLAGFLGYQLQLQPSLVISSNTHAWETPLRSGIPVLHLSSCFSAPICVDFSAKQEPNSCASCPLHLCFLLCSHKQAPSSLPFPPGLCFYCIMSGLTPECRFQHHLQQVLTSGASHH